MIRVGGLNLFVAAMWRSGSTHIANSMGTILNMRPASTTGFHGEGREQQNINPHSGTILFPYGGFYFQQHCWASTLNTSMLKIYNIRPVVVVRDLDDILVSLKEHIDNLDLPVIPGMETPRKWKFLDDHQKYDWLVTHALPWLLQFYWSWTHADIDKLFVRYEDFYKNQIAGCRNICKFLGVEPPGDHIIRKVCSENTNLVTGKVGRGKEMIPKYIRNRLNEVKEKERVVWED